MSSPLRIAAFAACAALLPAASAHAQAWVGMQNELSLSFDYNYSWSDQILSAGEARNNFDFASEDIVNQSFILGGEYTILDNWAVTATVPIVSSRYTGDRTVFPSHGRYDDGNFHTVLQDLSLHTRYQVLDYLPGFKANIAVAPHIGVSIPMTNYETNGYAGAGRGLKGLDVGGSIGSFLLSGIPGLYLHGSYTYTFRERYETASEYTSQFNQNSHAFNGQLGYFILDNLEVHAAMDMKLAVDGFDYRNFGDEPLIGQYYHDPLLAEDYLLFGGGVAYNVTPDIRVASMVRMFTWGNNTRNASLVGLSLGYQVL